MRPIDADALINEIKKETEKAIEQDDKVGSFWLGYIAGLVIKQPTIQSALDSETIIRTIETGITATNSNDAYSLGMRNGMRWCKSLIDGAEPKFEDDVMSVDDGKEQPTVQPEKAQLSQEGTTSDMIDRQKAIDALNEYFARIGKLKRRGLTEGEKAISLDTVGTIKTLPPAQPEPKEGYWINGKCNLCGEHAPFWAMASTYHESNYCPRCGAKMRGEQHETD